MIRKRLFAAGLPVAFLFAACQADAPPPPPPATDYVEPREPCAAHSPLRRAFFGDLHVHTSYSFDAYAFDVRVPPAQAYKFARGEAVKLPPLDGNGVGTQTLRLRRPLDFAAVTDHSEFLAEVQACITPGAPGYDSTTCQHYRLAGPDAVVEIGIKLALADGKRIADVCGIDGAACKDLLGEVWRRVQRAAADAYDRSASCSFTSFVAYEYTAATGLSTLHRNVIFKNDRVPTPITYFERPTPEGLWAELRTQCLQAGTGCDVLAIPHNSNESNGKMFLIEYPDGSTLDEQRAAASLRTSLEPVAEIYQHKGDSECMNGLAGVMGAADEHCSFEKTLRPPDQRPDCGDEVGGGGTSRKGCISRRDFLRNALLDGLREERRLGVNPLRLGFVASTDTHNGTPGAVDEDQFIGHRGSDDDTAQKQLGRGGLTPGGVEFGPGGLVGIWAEENSRPSLFDALRRREVFGTSGPRLTVRMFAGWDYPSDLCTDAQLVEKGYAGGVPMGGVLPPNSAAAHAPAIVVSALRDPGDSGAPADKLQVVQIVKGWLDGDTPRTKVFDVAGTRTTAVVDEATCAPLPGGADTLCAVFRDPEWNPQQPAYYYARVLQLPTCRWNARTCAAQPAGERPRSCSDPAIPKTVIERAWSSPVYYQPAP